jgi:hypothetical protein
MAEKEKKPSIGGLWEKVTKNGSVFLSGNIEIDGKKVRISCFQNGYKKAGDNQPDLRIYEDTWEPGQRSEAPAKPQEERHARPHDVEMPVPTYDTDDIPF